MLFLNMTSHIINVVGNNDAVASFKPSGEVARVAVELQEVDVVDGVSVFVQEVGEVFSLPSSSDNTVFIVSTMVRLACPDRKDLMSPASLILNGDGQPVGCRGFVRN